MMNMVDINDRIQNLTRNFTKVTFHFVRG